MEFILKQRLVGAVVLIALGVIFIPMLLEGPNRNLVPEMEPLPEPEDQPVTQPLERFPAAGEIPAEPAFSVLQTDSKPAAPPSAEQPEPGKKAPPPAGRELPLPLPEATPQPEAGPEPHKPAAAETQLTEPGALGHWVLQVGSFSNEQNALRLRDKLRGAHFVTQVERVRVAGKTRFRVRVGPYLERTEAQRDQKKLAKTFDISGRVLSYP